MNRKTIRTTSPRRWGQIALLGAATGLGAAPAAISPVLADQPSPALRMARQLGATLWTAAGEGGEGGEAGAVEGLDADLAYLGRLHIIEGHLRGAVALYALGMTDEAVGIAGHPEAEMMAEVREGLAAKGIADFSDLLTQVGTDMAEARPQARIDADLAALVQALRQAAAPEDEDLKDRFAALAILMRAAASEYHEALDDKTGAIADKTPLVVSQGFVLTARALLQDLAAGPEPKAAAAARHALAALTEADGLYADPANPVAGDPAILLGIAARIELAASQVR